MSTPVVESNTISSETGATTHTVDYPATVDAGDLLIIHSSVNGNPGITGSSGYTVLLDLPNGDSNTKIHVQAILAVGDEDGGTTTFATDATEASLNVVWRISNWGGTLATDVDISTGSTSAPPNPDAVTAGWGSDTNLFIALASHVRGDRSINAYPTDYTGNNAVGQVVSSAAGVGYGQATRALTADTDNPSAFAYASGTPGASSCTVVVKPALAGGNATLLQVTNAYRRLAG